MVNVNFVDLALVVLLVLHNATNVVLVNVLMLVANVSYRVGAMLSLLNPEWIESPQFRGSFMLSHFKGPRRVVITGMGCVTPI